MAELFQCLAVTQFLETKGSTLSHGITVVRSFAPDLFERSTCLREQRKV